MYRSRGYWNWLPLPDSSAPALNFPFLESLAHNLVFKLETLGLVWMWTVVSVWIGVYRSEGGIRPVPPVIQVPKSLSSICHDVFLGKSHGMACMLMVSGEGALVPMTLSCMVLRSHCFSFMWFLELEQGFRAWSFWWSGGCRECGVYFVHRIPQERIMLSCYSLRTGYVLSRLFDSCKEHKVFFINNYSWFCKPQRTAKNEAMITSVQLQNLSVSLV